MSWVQYVILAAQIVIALVGYFSIYRHRVIYCLKTHVYRLPSGTTLDTSDVCSTKHIDEDLRSGKYTVLQIVQRPIDGDLEVILGQIKR